MALVSSQSGFSPKAMIHASRSTTPIMLLHLPGGQPDETMNDEVRSLWWNGALVTGLLGDAYQIRQSHGAASSWSIWRGSEVLQRVDAGAL